MTPFWGTSGEVDVPEIGQNNDQTTLVVLRKGPKKGCTFSCTHMRGILGSQSGHQKMGS